MVSEHAFFGVICRDDAINKCPVLRIETLAVGPLCRKSHPLCRLKDPTVVYMTTCRLSSCKTGVYYVSSREGEAVWTAKKAARFVTGNYSYETGSMAGIL